MDAAVDQTMADAVVAERLGAEWNGSPLTRIEVRIDGWRSPHLDDREFDTDDRT